MKANYVTYMIFSSADSEITHYRNLDAERLVNWHWLLDRPSECVWMVPGTWSEE